MITGKSAMMLPCTASTMAAQLLTDGSRSEHGSLQYGSALRARIGEIETLVDHREIGDDVALHRLHDGGPIIDRWVLDLTALQAIALCGAHPMQDLAAPAFDGADRTTARRHGLRRSTVGAGRQGTFL